eukprot:TRINITY_DN74538_c0_g1_i1.p1 TRINITY_DN74538_c0_g1~~TRINITY_DN74538_c0_g1_i1.p1  ORF type:complete len:191 (+),score=17.25 TRINITY_DN74538_c0_g1_i1:762-1334(+)
MEMLDIGGSMETVEDWTTATTLGDMKRKVEGNSWSAIIVGSGTPQSFKQAYLKSVAFQLLPRHCKRAEPADSAKHAKSTLTHDSTCKIHIYVRPAHASYISAYDVEGYWCLASVCCFAALVKRRAHGPDTYAVANGGMCCCLFLPCLICCGSKWVRTPGTNLNAEDKEQRVDFSTSASSCEHIICGCKLS